MINSSMPRVANGLIAVALVLIAFVAVPGAAHARTGDDSRCTGVDANKPTLVCGPMVSVAGCPDDCGAFLGGNAQRCDENGCPDALAPEDSQCGTGYRLWDSQYSRLYWQWDYYVEGDDWILWDGQFSAKWPGDYMLPGGETGLTSIRVGVVDWSFSPGTIDTRIFWLCSPLGQAAKTTGAVAPAPLQPVGVERAGGPGDDSLEGEEGRNALIGGGGDDTLVGRDGMDHLDSGQGDDALHGGDHADQLYARGGVDEAWGGDHADDILTGPGDDESHGGRGDDQLFDNQGRDFLHGGPGDDRFSARDGHRDRIACGPGRDIAILDRRDEANGCEQVYLSKRETPKNLQ
jgi:hypothetical protein